MSDIKTVQDIREAFKKFFTERGHADVESSSLLVKDDPTTFFANSGMVQFKDVFTGREKRSYTTATTCQKCLRVSGKHNDYEQIGTTPRHHTFFEMLGNFSFGEYFKEQAIEYGWEFVTGVLKLDKSKIWVSVHEKDGEAEQLWKDKTGIDPKRIVKLGDDTNRWAMGEFGPNGYSSEIFYYIGDTPEKQSLEEFLKDDGTYLEIWNLVFMQFFKDPDGTQGDLPAPCIDTGMGLERVASVVQGYTSNYDTDTLRSLIAVTEKISGKSYRGGTYNIPVSKGDEQYKIDVSMRIIADHARAIAFLIADGAIPGNDGQSYVLRRLIRRAIRSGQSVGIEKPFLGEVLAEVEKKMAPAYPELIQQRDRIQKLAKKEELQFHETLRNGLKLLEDHSKTLSSGDVFPGEIAFQLYDTYGFPVDLTAEILNDRGISIDTAKFNSEMEKQKERSRGSARTLDPESLSTSFDTIPATKFVGYNATSATSTLIATDKASDDSNIAYLVFEKSPFYAEKGGQCGDTGEARFESTTLNIIDTRLSPGEHILHICEVSDDIDLKTLLQQEALLVVDQSQRTATAMHHSGTHLLNAALREVLGDHVSQKGSLVTSDRLRFDFSHDEALTTDELQKIQEYINTEIRLNHEVETKELSKEEALASGAVAAFGEKYGDVVRVVEMGPSVELCGGTHVKRTGDIGCEIITSEGSISSGVRRIEAVCGAKALTYISEREDILSNLSKKLQTPEHELEHKVQSLGGEIKALKQELKNRDSLLAQMLSEKLVQDVKKSAVGEISYITSDVSLSGRDALMKIADDTLARLQSGIVALGNSSEGMLVIKVSKDVSSKLGANTILNKAKEEISAGKGGGKPVLATLMLPDSDSFHKALTSIENIITTHAS